MVTSKAYLLSTIYQLAILIFTIFELISRDCVWGDSSTDIQDKHMSPVIEVNECSTVSMPLAPNPMTLTTESLRENTSSKKEKDFRK